MSMPRPFSRHHRGDFVPAQCVRSGHSEELIDLGADDIPGYGRVYFCIHCAAELIQQLGWVDPDVHRAQLAAMTAERDQWMQQSQDAANAELTQYNPRLEELTHGIRAVLDRFADSGDPAGGAVLAVSAPDESLVRPASDSPAEGDGPAGAGSAERSVGGGGGGDPELEGDGHSDSSSDGGAEAPAGDDLGAGEGDGDDFFGWVEQGAGDAGEDAVERDDGTGD